MGEVAVKLAPGVFDVVHLAEKRLTHQVPVPRQGLLHDDRLAVRRVHHPQTAPFVVAEPDDPARAVVVAVNVQLRLVVAVELHGGEPEAGELPLCQSCHKPGDLRPRVRRLGDREALLVVRLDQAKRKGLDAGLVRGSHILPAQALRPVEEVLQNVRDAVQRHHVRQLEVRVPRLQRDPRGRGTEALRGLPQEVLARGPEVLPLLPAERRALGAVEGPAVEEDQLEDRPPAALRRGLALEPRLGELLPPHLSREELDGDGPGPHEVPQPPEEVLLRPRALHLRQRLALVHDSGPHGGQVALKRRVSRHEERDRRDVAGRQGVGAQPRDGPEWILRRPVQRAHAPVLALLRPPQLQGDIVAAVLGAGEVAQGLLELEALRCGGVRPDLQEALGRVAAHDDPVDALPEPRQRALHTQEVLAALHGDVGDERVQPASSKRRDPNPNHNSLIRKQCCKS